MKTDKEDGFYYIRVKDGEIIFPEGRDDITVMYFPDKLTVEEFIEEVENKECNAAFVSNMNNLKNEPKYAEDWIRLYAAWKEMN